jgi:hypothetical protein
MPDAVTIENHPLIARLLRMFWVAEIGVGLLFVLARRTIPWEAVSWTVIFNGRSYSLQLNIAEPHRSEAGIFWYQRALDLFSRMLRHAEFNVATLGTGLSAEDIGQRMADFRPQA